MQGIHRVCQIAAAIALLQIGFGCNRSKNLAVNQSPATPSSVAPPQATQASTKTPSAIEVLHSAKPKASWNESSSVVADVTCQGSTSTVIIGSEGDQVLIGVVPADSGEPNVLAFPIRHGQQGGFCAVPVRIELNAMDCDSSYGKLEDCKPSTTCKAFAVHDDECDPFNFYWSAPTKELHWWTN